MKALLEQLTAEVNAVTFASAEEVEQFRVAYLGRKGKLKDLMAEFKTVPGADKRELGPMLNAFKQLVEAKVKEAQTATDEAHVASGEDLTKLGRRANWDPSPVASGASRNRWHL